MKDKTAILNFIGVGQGTIFQYLLHKQILRRKGSMNFAFTLSILSKLFMLLLSSVDFFKINFLKKKNSFRNILLECQMVCIQTRTNIVLVLIWVQTVCKGYQQTIKLAASKGRVNYLSNIDFLETVSLFTPPW